MAYNGWTGDYVDPAAFLEPLLDGRNLGATGNTDISYLDDPSVNARIDTANGLTGQRAPQRLGRPRRRLDAQRSSSGPRSCSSTTRDFVSPSFGCYVSNPAYGVDIVAACKK